MSGKPQMVKGGHSHEKYTGWVRAGYSVFDLKKSPRGQEQKLIWGSFDCNVGTDQKGNESWICQ